MESMGSVKRFLAGFLSVTLAAGIPSIPLAAHAATGTSDAVELVTAVLDKEAAHEQMRALQDTIESLRGQLGASPNSPALRQQLAAAGAELASLSAQLGGDLPANEGAAPAPATRKDLDAQRLTELRHLIDELEGQLGGPNPGSVLARYLAAVTEYESLSASYGGDQGAPIPNAGDIPHIVPSAPVGCVLATTTVTNSTPVPIPDSPGGPAVSTIVIAGAGAYTWDVDLTTAITHTFAADLDVTITSPAGTVVTLTTDNGGGNDNVYNGTLWDDQASPAAGNLVTDHTYVNLTLASPLVPEEAMGAFAGENPNGTWTIRIQDDLGTDTGTLNSWTLAVSTLPTPPTLTPAGPFTNAVATPIPDPGTTTSTIVVAGAGTSIQSMTMSTNIAHTWCADLDITLTSPSGRIVTITTDNSDDLFGTAGAFAGTLWNDKANPAGQVPYATNNGLVTDHAYVDGVLASPLVVEEALSAFQGENPNGTWTLTLTDDTGIDAGTLNSWQLNFQTAACGGGPCAGSPPTTFTNSTPVPIPTTAPPNVISSTIAVAGLGAFLYDLDLTTFIAHTFAGDLDMTLMSPAGTIVTFSSDNGSLNDDVYNGTVWNDSANPAGQVPYTTNNGLVTDHAYVNLTLASPLAPEEGLGAFYGENPNGTWTLTISDDANFDGGSLNSWSLAISTLAAPPTTTQTVVNNNTPVAIPTTAPPNVVTSTVAVAGAGNQVGTVRVTTNITHTNSSHLDVTLMSPVGTVVTLTTDNGGTNDNVYAGTLWDVDANPLGQVPYANNQGLVNDHAYVNLTLASPLASEESLAAFRGEDPNGTWTLTISDDANNDGGTLNSWSLEVNTTTCGAPLVSADLQMTKVDAADPVFAGQNISYTLTSLNAGPDPAVDVVITDTIPATTRFVSATPSGAGNCVTPAVGGSGAVTCTWLGPTPNATANSVQLVVRVCPETACNVIVTNTASTSSATIDVGPPANNSDTEQTTVQSQSDLGLGVVFAPNPVAAGGTLTFTATVTNAGPSNDPNPVFTQGFPAGWVVQTAVPSQGTCNPVGTNNITCNFGPLGAANQCTTVLPTVATVTYTVDVALLAFAGNYPVTSTVATGSCVADPNAANNTVVSSIDVVLLSDLILDKVAVPVGSVAAGREITYNLIVTSGPSQTAAFTLDDQLPAGVRFKSIRIPNGWFCTYPYVGTTGGKVSCVHPLLDPGTYTLGISVWAPPVCGRNLTVTNTAIVGSATTDPNVANNVDSVNTLVVGAPVCFQ